MLLKTLYDASYSVVQGVGPDASGMYDASYSVVQGVGARRVGDVRRVGRCRGPTRRKIPISTVVVRCPEVRLSEEGCYCGNRPSPAGTQCKAPHGNPQWSRFVVCLRIGQVRKASMCPKWTALSFSDKPQDNSTRSLGHCPTTLLSFTQGTCRQRRGGLTRHPSGLSPLHPLTPLPAPSSDCVLLSLLD